MWFMYVSSVDDNDEDIATRKRKKENTSAKDQLARNNVN